MKAHAPFILALVGACGSAFAQIEKVTIRTTGISCGICAAVSEIKFRLMPGIGQVAISLPTESITLTYKPDAVFSPSDLRQVLQALEVGVVQFTVVARGRVVEETGRRFFVTAKNKFVLPTEKAATIPIGSPVRIEAVVYDYRHPMELKLLTWNAY
jgi:hypothetical protein